MEEWLGINRMMSRKSGEQPQEEEDEGEFRDKVSIKSMDQLECVRNSPREI